jgi:hypothetical protein
MATVIVQVVDGLVNQRQWTARISHIGPAGRAVEIAVTRIYTPVGVAPAAILTALLPRSRFSDVVLVELRAALAHTSLDFQDGNLLQQRPALTAGELPSVRVQPATTVPRAAVETALRRLIH